MLTMTGLTKTYRTDSVETTALVAIDLPYRLALPLAVFAAITAGSLADVLAERADLRRIRGAHPSAEAGRSTDPSRES